jgi:hypothetical protein
MRTAAKITGNKEFNVIEIEDYAIDRVRLDNGMSGTIYGMAFIGAVIYYVRHAVTFGAGIIGIFKAIFWPAVLMYKLLDLLRM